jgi:hypothetical protein
MIIFYEKQYAEQLLDKGFASFMNQRDLIILAKYLKSLGKNKTQIRSDLVEFCYKYNQGFNEIIYSNKIETAIKTALKYPIKPHIDVPITVREMNAIKSCQNYKKEKILLVMLTIAKFFREVTGKKGDYYVNTKFAQIVKMAKVNISKNERNEIRYELNQVGLITTSYSGGFRINFVAEGDVAFIVTDLDNIVSFLPYYCAKCGKQIEKKLPRHDMCKECYIEHKSELDKQKYARYNAKR